MYSTTINQKVDIMFAELRKKVSTIVAEAPASNEVATTVTRLITSELTTRSKSILSDMLFDLSDKLMETEFFSDISKQNKFFEINLRQEILDKYQFASNTAVNYKEASRALQALKAGGATFLVGGAMEVGIVLKAGLSFSSLVPVPVSLLLAASVGAFLVDYYAIEPARNKKAMGQALDRYLIQTQEQFLGWFDEVELFFNKRVEEIKQTM